MKDVALGNEGVLVLFGLAAVVLYWCREIVCWLVRTSKILEKIEEQLTEIRTIKSQIEPLKSQIENQARTIASIQSDTAQLRRDQQ